MKSADLVTLLMTLLAAVSLLWLTAACGDDDDDDSGAADDDDDNDDASPSDDDDDNDDDNDTWQPVEPHRETYEGFTVVWLAGSAFEMGQQQGQLLHEELKAGIDWLNEYHLIDLLLPIARWLGLIKLAQDNSYPDVLNECQGLVSTAGDAGWTMDICLLLNFGDVLVEFLGNGFPPARAMKPGCSQAVATDDASADGRLYHGRSLDWSKIDYLLDYPVIFVRQPNDGISHVYIGFPGNLSPYNGINAAGVSIASDEADPLDNSVHDRVGRSHVQMLGQALKRAHNLTEAHDFILSQDHMTVEIFTVADGVNRQAEVFEMTAGPIGVRPLQDGVVYATNHFVAPETENADADPASSSSLLRFDRLKQLVPADGVDTLHGSFDPPTMVSVLRDRVNPYTGDESPPDVFENDESIATNGAIYQMVFDPANLWFWVAAGGIPVPQQPFVGFSLSELLELPDATPCDPAVIE